MRTLLILGIALVAAATAPPASSAVAWFHSPSGNIACEVASKDRRGTYATCQTVQPPRKVRLDQAGRLRRCSGIRCLGNPPETSFRLRYGRSATVGVFRCTSLRRGMRCVVRATGRGFLINRAGITAIRPARRG